MVGFSCAIDAVRAANLILDEPYYDWKLVSAEGGTVGSSSEVTVPVEPLEALTSPDLIAVCGGDSSHNYHNRSLTNWLHDKAKAGSRIGSISDGAFVVAQTGLFDRCPSTIHWRCFDAYRERFPDLDIRPSIMELTSNRFSCAGGTASLDLMLHLINETHGREVASFIAQNFFHDTIRDSSIEQHRTNAYRLASRKPLVSEALLLMESHLEQRLSISDIASLLKISRRQFDRIFKEELQDTPQSYYRNLRLSRASGLLIQTNLNITEVAIGCGFQSASHLGKHFLERFGTTPGKYRRKHGASTQIRVA